MSDTRAQPEYGSSVNFICDIHFGDISKSNFCEAEWTDVSRDDLTSHIVQFDMSGDVSNHGG